MQYMQGKNVETPFVSKQVTTIFPHLDCLFDIVISQRLAVLSHPRKGGLQVLPSKIKHRHAKRARVIFFVIGAFVKLFAAMVWLNVQYDVHTMLHR